MKLKKVTGLIITGLIISGCSWGIFSRTPGWYHKNYDESTTFYSRGFGQSREEDFATKKAVTEANSAIAVKCRAYLADLSTQMMKKNGVDEKSDAAKDYTRAILRAEKKIRRITENVHEEKRKSDTIFKVYKLVKVEKDAIKKLYLLELFD